MPLFLKTGLPEPKSWIWPDREAFEDHGALLVLVAASFTASATHAPEQLEIWRHQLATYGTMANDCWVPEVHRQYHLAPPIWLVLVANKKKGMHWQNMIKKEQKKGPTLTPPLVWRKMQEAAGDAHSSLLSPAFQQHVHSTGDGPLNCAKLLRMFLELINDNNQLALAIYIALMAAIDQTGVLQQDFIAHFTAATVLLLCAGHDWETILPVSLNEVRMTAYLLGTAPHGTQPLSWWAYAMSAALHFAKDPTIGLADVVRVVCCDSRSLAQQGAHATMMGPFQSRTLALPARVRCLTLPKAPRGTCTFWLDNISPQRICGQYAFRMNLPKSVICENVQVEDAPLSSIDEVVDITATVKKVMLANLRGAAKIRVDAQMALRAESDNMPS